MSQTPERGPRADREPDVEWADLNPAAQARQLFADSLLERLHHGADPELQVKLRAAFERLEAPQPASDVRSFYRSIGRQAAAAASLIIGLGLLLFLLTGPGASSAEAMLERARANATGGGLRSFEILREWPSLARSKRIGQLHLGEQGEYSVVIEGDYGPCRMGRRGGEHWKHGPMERFGDRGTDRTFGPTPEADWKSGWGGERERDEKRDRKFGWGPKANDQGAGWSVGSGGGPLTDWLDTSGVELPYATLEEIIGLFDEGYALEVISVRTQDGDVRERLIAEAEGASESDATRRPDRIELQLGRAGTGIEELKLYWKDVPRFGRWHFDRERHDWRKPASEQDAAEQAASPWADSPFAARPADDAGGAESERSSDEESGGDSGWGAFRGDWRSRDFTGPQPDWRAMCSQRFPDLHGEFDFEAFDRRRFAAKKEQLGLGEEISYEQFKQAERERSIVIRLLDETPPEEVFVPVLPGEDR
jgi:hypothetical protein